MNKILSLTQHVISTNGIKFNIITTEGNICFIDQHGDELNWDNTLENQLDVNNMVNVLEG